MRLFYLIALISLLICSCTETDKPIVEDPIEKDPDSNSYKDEASIRRHVEAQLKIPGTEKYTIRIYSEHMDEDDSLDKLITVNLYDRAIEEASASEKVAKRAEMGYMGNYNFLFYVDGKTQVITSAMPVPSSPHAPLSIQFENITSDVHQDFTVDYRIRNSCFRQFYTISHRIPIQVSQTEIFTDLGLRNQKVYHIEYEESQVSFAKNIVVYEGKTAPVTFDDPDDVYSHWPKIDKTGKLVRRWYYSPEYMKYYLRKEEM